MNDFQAETDSRSVDGILSKLNTHYIVVDIGGGTLDVTVHEIQDDGTIKEIHKVTGGPYGGIYVNQRFESLLEELFRCATASNVPESSFHLIGSL
ncbi:hypothetical protein OS493_038955 [Desmophyllum pertusum]|uniref:Uncharacterized protein n=1 Tax=Desmophyllum pertusum TaxID=174260 RepID=A0A9W9ZHU3_9CNID|nr:hypothetical protein OS493_038955 [Desmophyllum pertusum]